MDERAARKAMAKRIGANIKRLREAKGYGLYGVSAGVGVGTLQAVWNWESGNSMPTVYHLKRLAEFFGVTMDELVR